MTDFEWDEYDWKWSSPEDVREFVDIVLENHETYEYAYPEFSDSGDENYYSQWWTSVQYAISHMGKTFSREDLEVAIEHLLAPEGDYVECDPAIFDGLLKFIPGFPVDFAKFNDVVEVFLGDGNDYTSDWWDYSYYPFIGAELTWTFWGPETMARSRNIDPKYLTRIFVLSFIAGNPYKAFRARLALATNPNCPSEILDFLFSNRNNADWLIYDEDEEGVLSSEQGTYSINDGIDSIEQLRENAALTEAFKYPSDSDWSSSPGAHYVANILDIEWDADSARTCLLAAFAQNSALSQSYLTEIAKEEHPLIQYFLSQNPSIPKELQEYFAAKAPTFSYVPYGSNPRYTDEVTLGA